VRRQTPPSAEIGTKAEVILFKDRHEAFLAPQLLQNFLPNFAWEGHMSVSAFRQNYLSDGMSTMNIGIVGLDSGALGLDLRSQGYRVLG